MRGEQVEHAQLPVAQPLVDDDGNRASERLEGDLGGLPGAQVARRPRRCRTFALRKGGDPFTERRGLLLPRFRQRNIGVAQVDRDDVEPRCLRGRRGEVGDALAVTDEPEIVDSHGLEANCASGARLRLAPPALGR